MFSAIFLITTLSIVSDDVKEDIRVPQNHIVVFTNSSINCLPCARLKKDYQKNKAFNNHVNEYDIKVFFVDLNSSQGKKIGRSYGINFSRGIPAIVVGYTELRGKEERLVIKHRAIWL